MRTYRVRMTAAGWTNAPYFAEIAKRPTTTTPSLEAAVERPHSKMSANAARSPSKAAAPRNDNSATVEP